MAAADGLGGVFQLVVGIVRHGPKLADTRARVGTWARSVWYTSAKVSGSIRPFASAMTIHAVGLVDAPSAEVVMLRNLHRM